MHVTVARKHYRRTVRRSVLLSCQVVKERGFRLVSSIAFDLSTDGMLVLTGERVLTGEPLLVSFRAPRSDRWFNLEAQVARVIHGRRPSDQGRCLGLSFSGLGDADHARLFESIRDLPAPSTRRLA